MNNCKRKQKQAKHSWKKIILLVEFNVTRQTARVNRDYVHQGFISVLSNQCINFWPTFDSLKARCLSCLLHLASHKSCKIVCKQITQSVHPFIISKMLIRKFIKLQSNFYNKFPKKNYLMLVNLTGLKYQCTSVRGTVSYHLHQTTSRQIGPQKITNKVKHKNLAQQSHKLQYFNTQLATFFLSWQRLLN